MGRKGRGRKIGEEDESQTEWQPSVSSTQDSVDCSTHHSPALSRYLTRHAKAVLGQDSSPRYPIRSTRCISNDSEIPIQPQVTPNHTGTPRLAKRGKKLDSSNSISKSNTSNDEVDLESLISKVIFPQTQAQSAAAFSAAHEVVFNDHLPTKEANEASNTVGSRPQGSANNGGNQREENLGQTFSLNVTEIVETSDDDSHDLNEVGSSLDSALVTVNGYRVKPEWASLLRAIFLRYGDVANECSFMSVEIRSSLLEKICEIIQKLQDTEVMHITPVDLKSMLDQGCDLETVKMEVGWLHQRLDEISEAMQLFKGGYTCLKKEQSRNDQVIEKKEEELKSFKRQILALQEQILALEERVVLAEDELIPRKAEADKIKERISESREKVKYFFQQSLVRGLL